MKRKFLGFIVMLVCIFGITAISVSAATGDQIVAKAREQLGKSYSSSDRLGPNSFDCSGLVWYVCNQLGISMSSGNCQSQMSYGTTIDHSALRNSFDCSNLQVGDLIFFDYRDDGIADHIGIYSGNGNMIDALNSNYYGNKVVEHSINVTGNSSVSSTKKFWAYTCGIRRVAGGTPPSNPKLIAYKKRIPSGQSILFEYSVNNAKNMYIAIDVNGVREHFIEVSGDHYNGTFTKAGHYEAYLYATNSAGNSGLSNCVQFDVYNSKPTNCTVSADTTSTKVNNPIKFTMTANYAERYSLNVYRDNVNIKNYRYIEDGDNKNYSVTFSEPGTYKIYAVAYNYYDLCESTPIYITIQSNNPTTSTTATRTSGAIEVQTTISNLSQSASCVAAVYDSSGKLIEQAANDVDGSTNSVTTYFPNHSNASYIKVFLWNSLEGMKPLTNGEKVNL